MLERVYICFLLPLRGRVREGVAESEHGKEHPLPIRFRGDLPLKGER
jgi:hypothetical protein